MWIRRIDAKGVTVWTEEKFALSLAASQRLVCVLFLSPLSTFYWLAQVHFAVSNPAIAPCVSAEVWSTQFVQCKAALSWPWNLSVLKHTAHRADCVTMVRFTNAFLHFDSKPHMILLSRKLRGDALLNLQYSSLHIMYAAYMHIDVRVAWGWFKLYLWSFHRYGETALHSLAFFQSETEVQLCRQLLISALTCRNTAWKWYFEHPSLWFTFRPTK